mgnify:CR=1 FL=1
MPLRLLVHCTFEPKVNARLFCLTSPARANLIASITALLDPEIVVIGGGLSQLGDLLLKPIQDAYLEHLPARGFRPELKIAMAELVNEAGAIGAADLAREHSGAR